MSCEDASRGAIVVEILLLTSRARGVKRDRGVIRLGTIVRANSRPEGRAI